MKFASLRALLLSVAGFGALAEPVGAQDHDAQLWMRADATVELRRTLDLKLETNQRLSDDRGGLYESQYLVALAVELSDGVTLTGGVNRVVELRDGSVANTEWRPRQQISFPITDIGKGKLTGQLRLEQRFRTDDDKVGHRFRPEITYALPLRENLELRLAHESYINLNSAEFQVAGHERMRNSASLIVDLSKHLKVQIGYINQYRFNESPDLVEHGLSTGLSVKF